MRVKMRFRMEGREPQGFSGVHKLNWSVECRPLNREANFLSDSSERGSS